MEQNKKRKDFILRHRKLTVNMVTSLFFSPNIILGVIHISGDTKFGFFSTLPPYYDTMMTLWSDPSLPLMTGDT